MAMTAQNSLLVRAAESLAAIRPNSAHIVDTLIEERGEKIIASRYWPVLRPILYRFLGYDKAVSMADALTGMNGHDALSYAGGLLNMQITATGLANIPKSGGFVLAANHPTGIADGIAVYELLRQVRDDIAIYTNRDAIRVCAGLSDILIPVEWRVEHRSREKTKETLRISGQAFRDGKAIVIFPSGRIAYWDKDENALTERPWQPTAVSLAKKNSVPLIPVNISARNSGLFYLLSRFSQELRDMTVFHEVLNKKNAHVHFTIGKAVSPDVLSGDQAEHALALRRHCISALRDNPDASYVSPVMNT